MYGKSGTVVDKATYEDECGDVYFCEKIGETYYDSNGSVVDYLTYAKSCESHTCEILEDTYFDKNGNVVEKDEFESSCNVVENPKTGNGIPFKVILFLLFIVFVCCFVTKRYDKFRKIN